MSCNGCSFNNNSTNSIAQGYDWLSDLPDTTDKSDIVEVKFKSTRKEYYKNLENIPLKRGDRIVVATSPGHDVGEVTLTGYLAEKQFKLRIKNPARYTLNTVYRKASEMDLENLKLARSREKETMIRARMLAKDLGLEMKIGDVEFRGDNKKAIFYYLAEGRVDFRELIKVYAREFRIKIEMKQIGARQEAGLIGGIGSCGRELCCSSWRTDFSSISSEAALKQGLSPSAQKMAGACGKLKCCLLYELDAYIEAGNEFPRELLDLELKEGMAKPFKTDFLKKEVWYTLKDSMGVTFNLSLKQVKDIIQKNKRGLKPAAPIVAPQTNEENQMEVTLDESLDRFDNKKSSRKKRRRNKKGNRNLEQKNKQHQKNVSSKDNDEQRGQKKRRSNNPKRKGKPAFKVKKEQSNKSDA